MLFVQHHNMILFIQCSLFNCFIIRRYGCGYYSLDLVWFDWTFNLVPQLRYNDVFLRDVWMFSKPPLTSKRFLKVFIGLRITQMFHQMKNNVESLGPINRGWKLFLFCWETHIYWAFLSFRWKVIAFCWRFFFFLLNSKSGLNGSVLHGIRSRRIKLQWDVSHNIPSCAP